MARWWTVIALVPFLLAGTASVRAQFEPDPPPPPTGAFVEEPRPLGGPEFCPESTKPTCWAVPFGPRFDLFNAFTEECHGPEYCVYYGSLGALALQRQRLGGGVVAVLDPDANVAVRADAGDRPPANSPVALGFGDVQTPFSWGVQGTIGTRLGPYALELSGFILPWNGSTSQIQQVGAYDVPFGAFLPPAGFQGVNDIWLQADRVEVTLQTRVSNGEANFRYQWLPQVEGILGARYFEVGERFSIYTGEEDLTRPQPNLGPLQATYLTTALSQIAGPQVGFQAETFLVPNVSLSLANKDMVGANIYHVGQALLRGDGAEGPNGDRQGVRVSEVFEIDAILNIWLNEHIRFRAGYMALWAVGVPVASQQVNFNPNIGGGRSENNGSIFFSGPMVDVMLAF